MPDVETRTYPLEQLEEFSIRVFLYFGVPERDAEIIRRTEGIPLVLPVVEDLRVISRHTGIPLD